MRDLILQLSKSSIYSTKPDLARKLSISIVAEGVETKEQLDYLNQNNITFQQGYYFYKPVTYIDLVKIILSKPKVKVVVE